MYRLQRLARLDLQTLESGQVFGQVRGLWPVDGDAARKKGIFNPVAVQRSQFRRRPECQPSCIEEPAGKLNQCLVLAQAGFFENLIRNGQGGHDFHLRGA